MTFPLKVKQGEHFSIEVLGVIDTGAGAGYLLVPKGTALPMNCRRINSPTVLADGRPVNISEEADVTVQVREIAKEVTLRILVSEDNGMSVLFGRELIHKFNLVIYGCDKVVMKASRRSAIVYQRSRDRLAFLEPVPEDQLEDILPDGVVALDPSVLEQSESVLWPLSESILKEQISQLDGLSAGAPQPLPYCFGVKLGLRRLRSNERKDTVNQLFCFEIDAPSVPPSGASRLYASAAYAKLSPHNKAQFRQLVDEYVKTGWWIEVSRAEAIKYGNPANIFGVEQHGKLRLVADFRDLNQHFKASTELPRISSSLLGLTISAEDSIMIGDCRSAFLRVRLKRGLWVHTGDRDFLTYRMSFGLSFGPEGLRCSAGKLWTIAKNSSTATGLGSLFADDWFLKMMRTGIQDEGARLLNLLSLAGFDCARKKFQFPTAGETVKLFNCALKFEAERTTVECGREQRMRKCAEILNIKSPTKSQCFQLAGCLSYDPTKLHPEARLVSDILRSLVGKACSQTGWTAPIDLQPAERKVYEALTEWIQELIHEPCRHSVSIDRGASEINLKLQVDASFLGQGSCILFRGKDEKWTVVQADCSAWKLKQINNSINRLEATALLGGLQRISDFLSQFHASTFGRKKVINLAIECDNATSVAWATKGPTPIVAKSSERRAIMRLCDGLQEELQAIHDQVAQLEIKHLQGTENSIADKLSRLLQRETTSSMDGTKITLGELLRAGTKPTDKVQAVREIPEEDTRTLVEELCEDAWDLEDAIDKFSRLTEMVRRWKGASTGNRTEARSAFFRSAQQELDNPKRYNQKDGLATIEFKGFDENLKCLIVIPRKSKNLKALVFKTFHRLNAHRGRRHTMADVNKYFFLEGGHSTARMVLAQCLVCAKKNAASFQDPVLPVAVLGRRLDLPVFARVTIDHVFVRPTCLSIMCIDTGLLCLIPVEDLRTENAVAALQKVAHRYCVDFKLIHSDSYSALKSPELLASIRRLGHLECEATLTSPGASQTNPVERMHKEVWSILRCRKFCSRIREVIDPNPKSVETILDEVCYIINTRPIGLDEDSPIPITPATLAFGTQAEARPIRERLWEVRNYFYERCFDNLRRRFTDKNLRKALVRVGQNVLVRIPEVYRGDFPVVAGRIVSIQGAKIFVKNKEKTYEASSTQVIPLSGNFQSEEEGQAPPGGACGGEEGVATEEGI